MREWWLYWWPHWSCYLGWTRVPGWWNAYVTNRGILLFELFISDIQKALRNYFRKKAHACQTSIRQVLRMCICLTVSLWPLGAESPYGLAIDSGLPIQPPWVMPSNWGVPTGQIEFGIWVVFSKRACGYQDGYNTSLQTPQVLMEYDLAAKMQFNTYPSPIKLITTGSLSSWVTQSRQLLL